MWVCVCGYGWVGGCECNASGLVGVRMRTMYICVFVVKMGVSAISTIASGKYFAHFLLCACMC